MSITTSAAKACDFVLFGTKGDLARRKLLPSLYQLDKAQLLHEETQIVGVAKDSFSRDEFIVLVRKALDTFVKEELCEDTVTRFSPAATMLALTLPNLPVMQPSTSCSILPMLW